MWVRVPAGEGEGVHWPTLAAARTTPSSPSLNSTATAAWCGRLSGLSSGSASCLVLLEHRLWDAAT